jgi:hypothetical protein
LRDEIAQISGANRLYLQGGNKMPGSGGIMSVGCKDQDILDKLVSLTDWKKL